MCRRRVICTVEFTHPEAESPRPLWLMRRAATAGTGISVYGFTVNHALPVLTHLLVVQLEIQDPQ